MLYDPSGYLILFMIGYLVLVVALTFLGAWIFSLVFRVKKNLWYQQKQMDILIAMASKAGVSDDDLDEIINRQVK